MPEPHDLFISFHRHCAEPAKRLSTALEALGVSCVAAGESGPEAGIPAGLTNSKAFLAWCCGDYFRSRPCQRHLAAAYIAQRREPPGAPERILLINAQPGVRHIYPVHLRERLFAYAPGLPEAPDFQELAEWLREHCAALSGTLGPLVQPGWLEAFDSVGTPAPRFEGRDRELWDIHAALHPAAPGVPHESAGPVVVVSGDAGQGKSCLAREYAFRFGPAFPGGLFRLAAGEAKPAISRTELAENPALRIQLSALLRRLSPGFNPDGLDVPELSQRLGELLADAARPFLWIVDDLPDGLNGPAFRQWLAPDSAGPRGRTLVTTRSRRYDTRAEAIHLPPLDRDSALRLLLRESSPASESEREAVEWLLEDLGREARAMALAGALAGMDRHPRRGPYDRLCRRMEAYGREAADIAARWAEELPKEHGAAIAALLRLAIDTVEASGRNLLRLAGELGDAALPLDFVADCFRRSGLRPDEEKIQSFAIFITEPAEEPVTAEMARAHAEAGMAALERLSLAERTDGGVRVHRQAARIMASVSPDSAKRAALHGAALDALYAVAESCVADGDWQPLAPLASHARALVGDLRQRPVDRLEDPAEAARRIRLALVLAEMDAELGARQRAMHGYRTAAAYLIRAMNADPHNPSRQRDFARAQERIGDLLAAQGDLPGALDRFRKSLGIRAYLAKQDPAGPERQRDLLRHHLKIGEILEARGDLEGALQSYRAAHGILEKRAGEAPSDAECQFDLAASYERQAALYVRLGDAGTALSVLSPALHLYEGLAEAHPGYLPFVRAPAVVHNMIGDLLRGRADLSVALDRYRTALAITEKLTALEPANPDWQHDLALCHNNIGNVLAGLDDSAGAAKHYRRFLAITERLTEKTGRCRVRPRDLATGYLKLGMATEQAPADALVSYQKARAILEKLAAVTPHNEALRKDLAWARERIESLSEPKAAASAASAFSNR